MKNQPFWFICLVILGIGWLIHTMIFIGFELYRIMKHRATMPLRFKKWQCKHFGCKIVKHLSQGFLHFECHRCGDVFKITSKEKDWYNRGIKAILVDCGLFSSGFNIEDYRKVAAIKDERTAQ